MQYFLIQIKLILKSQEKNKRTDISIKYSTAVNK